MAILIVVLMYGVWSSMFSLAKLGLQYSPPLFLTGVRMLMGAAILLGYLAWKNRGAFKLDRKQIFSLSILAIFSIYLTKILEFWALQYLSAAKTCFIYSLSPFFAALFSYLHFREKMNGRKWIGLSIGFIGMIPVLMQQTGVEELLNITGFLSWPSLAVIIAALCSVYGWVLLRLLVKDEMISPVMANGSSMLVGGLLALGHSFFTDTWSPTPVATPDWSPFLGWTVVMCLISNVLCFNLYGMMLKRFTATFLSFLGLLSPIFASLYGWLFLGEPLSWVIFLSTSILLIGLWVVYSAELKQGYIARQRV